MVEGGVPSYTLLLSLSSESLLHDSGQQAGEAMMVVFVLCPSIAIGRRARRVIGARCCRAGARARRPD